MEDDSKSWLSEPFSVSLGPPGINKKQMIRGCLPRTSIVGPSSSFPLLFMSFRSSSLSMLDLLLSSGLGAGTGLRLPPALDGRC